MEQARLGIGYKIVRISIRVHSVRLERTDSSIGEVRPRFRREEYMDGIGAIRVA